MAEDGEMMEGNNAKLDDAMISDSDTDSDEKMLAKEYGVIYQYTFVQIDSDANVVTKWNSGNMAELLSNIKWHLWYCSFSLLL